MSLKKNRDLLIIIILLPFLLWGAFFISQRMENSLPSYSVINKSAGGMSVFYEALEALGYPVERTLEPVEMSEPSNIQIVADGGFFRPDSQQVLNWLAMGGKLVYLVPSPFDSSILKAAVGRIKDGSELYGGTEKIFSGDVNVYAYGQGTLIAANLDSLSNKALAGNYVNAGTGLPFGIGRSDERDAGDYAGGSETAYGLLQAMSKLPYEKICFNEYYLYGAGGQKSFWEWIPGKIKIILYQLLLILAALLYSKGKRFGKAVPYYEETERADNEYLHAVASLYKQANCWDLMYESYYKAFIRQFNSGRPGLPADNWLQLWEREGYPAFGKAKTVYAFHNGRDSETNESKVNEFKVKEAENDNAMVNETGLGKVRTSEFVDGKVTGGKAVGCENEAKHGLPAGKASRSEYVRQVVLIDQLMEIVKRRREEYWKRDRK